MSVIDLIVFVFGTIVIVWMSRSPLRNVRSHGFYRFFAWEFILVLFVLNVNYWIVDPFSFHQIISWALLIVSLSLIIQGVRLFRKEGNIDQKRNDSTLVGIERTTRLVTSGIYRYIRHPFYSSLLFLAWGIFFKRPAWLGAILAVLTTACLIVTAKKEEIENIDFFGKPYQEYMEGTKMFIPFIL
jgi:protein-S-isoprenylcysteine O-methyltransferase Ste14